MDIGTDILVPIKLRELYQVIDRLPENNMLVWVLEWLGAIVSTKKIFKNCSSQSYGVLSSKQNQWVHESEAQKIKLQLGLDIMIPPGFNSIQVSKGHIWIKVPMQTDK